MLMSQNWVIKCFRLLFAFIFIKLRPYNVETGKGSSLASHRYVKIMYLDFVSLRRCCLGLAKMYEQDELGATLLLMTGFKSVFFVSIDCLSSTDISS